MATENPGWGYSRLQGAADSAAGADRPLPLSAARLGSLSGEQPVEPGVIQILRSWRLAVTARIIADELASEAYDPLQICVRPMGPIPLRLIVGYGFMEHGLAKLAKGPDAFVVILHALGVPAPHFMVWAPY
jgi:DoxX